MSAGPGYGNSRGNMSCNRSRIGCCGVGVGDGAILSAEVTALGGGVSAGAGETGTEADGDDGVIT